MIDSAGKELQIFNKSTMTLALIVRRAPEHIGPTSYLKKRKRINIYRRNSGADT